MKTIFGYLSTTFLLPLFSLPGCGDDGGSHGPTGSGAGDSSVSEADSTGTLSTTGLGASEAGDSSGATTEVRPDGPSGGPVEPGSEIEATCLGYIGDLSEGFRLQADVRVLGRGRQLSGS